MKQLPQTLKIMNLQEYASFLSFCSEVYLFPEFQWKKCSLWFTKGRMKFWTYLIFGEPRTWDSTWHTRSQYCLLWACVGNDQGHWMYLAMCGLCDISQSQFWRLSFLSTELFFTFSHSKEWLKEGFDKVIVRI